MREGGKVRGIGGRIEEGRGEGRKNKRIIINVVFIEILN